MKKKKLELKKLQEDIFYNREKSLQEIDKQLSELKEKLNTRKNELRAELELKIAELNEKAAAMMLDITILESEIYTTRSYAGETLELTRIREGKPAEVETPLILNQKILYLDEDLGRIISIYQNDIVNKYNIFEDAIKNSDEY